MSGRTVFLDGRRVTLAELPLKGGGQAAVFLKKLVDTFEVVRNPGDFTSQTAVTNAVNCPAGKRALAGGGTTNAVGLGLFLTQINLNAATVGVRWESASPVTGQSEAWALCASA